MSEHRFLAFDIGCIECGEPSAVIGRFTTRTEAEAACKQWEDIGWRGGQHYYAVFDLNAPVGSPEVSS